MEAGIELGFLHDRIAFNASYYRHRTSNQIVQYPLPSMVGGSSITANLPAVVENRGLELELNSINISSPSFTWRSSFNISFPRNKLVSFPGIEKTSYASNYIVGESLFILKRFLGTGVDPQTGAYTFLDVDNNGTISAPNDYVYNKEIAQKYFGGFSNSFSWKNFELSFLLYFVKQTGTNYLRAFNMPGAFGQLANQPVSVLSRWQKPGDNAPVQRFSQDYSSAFYTAFSRASQNSDMSVGDASFIRLRNLYLAYSFPQSLRTKLNIKTAKVYLQCQNLFTITKYDGIDPETKGIAIPVLRMITGGIQLTL